MSNIIIKITAILGVTLLAGCLWSDDFRDRVPTQLERPLRPTLNPDSVDYAGDPIFEEMLEDRLIQLPDIDCLSEIPEPPDYPAGVYCD